MVTLALIGKHPTLGDFVQRGIGAEQAATLTGWLDPCLHAARTQAGDGWEALWDGARSIRFWWGRVLLGQTMAGVMVPSRDKVGRRYPLVLSLVGAAVPPPLAVPDQRLWQRLEALLASLEPGGEPGLAGLLPEALDLDGLEIAAETPQALTEGPTLWAHRPGGDLETLLAEAGPVDAIRAATARSYWWHPGREDGPAAYLGLNGWPDAGALCWLLATGHALRPEPTPAEPEGAEAHVSD